MRNDKSKKNRGKPLYSLSDNIPFFIKKAWKMDKGLILATVVFF